MIAASKNKRSQTVFLSFGTGEKPPDIYLREETEIPGPMECSIPGSMVCEVPENIETLIRRVE